MYKMLECLCVCMCVCLCRQDREDLHPLLFLAFYVELLAYSLTHSPRPPPLSHRGGHSALAQSAGAGPGTSVCVCVDEYMECECACRWGPHTSPLISDIVSCSFDMCSVYVGLCLSTSSALSPSPSPSASVRLTKKRLLVCVCGCGRE